MITEQRRQRAFSIRFYRRTHTPRWPVRRRDLRASTVGYWLASMTYGRRLALDA